MMFTYFPQAQAAFDVDDTSETRRTRSCTWAMRFRRCGAVRDPADAATALVILRYGALPRWFAWLSLALALILVIFPIGWLGVIAGLPLWTLIAQSALLRPAGEPATAGPPAAQL